MESMILHGHWLAQAFAILMAVSMLLYVILDGYDLGVGMLMSLATDEQRDTMIASIGPFWDANETWLVLGVGILLVAFPAAHGLILSSLYLPVTLMLIALVIRGVSFDFRAKVHASRKGLWNNAFMLGSLLAALAQGYMLGLYIMGFENTVIAHAFSSLIAISFVAAYCMMAGGWLVMKTEHVLQQQAVRWMRYALWFTAAGIVLISVVTPAVNADIHARWFSWPNLIMLAPIPLLTGLVVLLLDRVLSRMPFENDRYCGLPLLLSVLLFLLCFIGLAFSFYPYIVPGRMTVFGAASAPESLMIIFIGAIVVLPCIFGYSVFAYRVFWGKVRPLSYG